MAIPIFVFVPALLFPFWPVYAAGPRLIVGGNAVPGASVTVGGDGFNARTRIQLEWDGSAAGQPTVWTSSQSTFGTSLKIPANATPGPHLVGAGAFSRSGRGAASAATPAALASATVMVLDPAATPAPVVTVTPDPTQTVTPDPTQTAAPDPTPTPVVSTAPTPTPVVSAAPTPTPVVSAAPTPTPVVTAAPTPTPVVTAAPTPTPVVTPSAASCVGTLQSQIDAAPAGSVLDLTGCTYAVGAKVTKPLTIVGATIKPPAGTTGLVVSANGVTLDGLHIIGPQAMVYNGGEFGIYVEATASAPVRGLTIRNCEVAEFGKAGMWLRYVSNLVVEHNTVHDTVYAGIMVLSGSGGSISGNVVQRIGVVGSQANGGNAYGISLEDQGLPVTADFTVSNNTVTDVPTWHGFDTHGGLRISFTNNTVLRCSRGIFITQSESGSGAHATNITLDHNQVLSPAPVTFNLVPITLYAVNGVTFTGNTISGWGSASPTSAAPYYDYTGLSTGIVVGPGNTVTP